MIVLSDQLLAASLRTVEVDAIDFDDVEIDREGMQLTFGVADEIELEVELEFEDVGFADVQPMDIYLREIESRPPEMYGWVQTEKFNTRRGAGVGQKHEWARSVVVLIRNYHRRAFPPRSGRPGSGCCVQRGRQVL